MNSSTTYQELFLELSRNFTSAYWEHYHRLPGTFPKLTRNFFQRFPGTFPKFSRKFTRAHHELFQNLESFPLVSKVALALLLSALPCTSCVPPTSHDSCFICFWDFWPLSVRFPSSLALVLLFPAKTFYSFHSVSPLSVFFSALSCFLFTN